MQLQVTQAERGADHLRERITEQQSQIDLLTQQLQHALSSESEAKVVEAMLAASEATSRELSQVHTAHRIG